MIFSDKNMRRKKKFGVYTNATIKNCSCDYFCRECKSLCKAVYKGKVDLDSVTHTSSNSTRKMHQFGYGSLMPGKKFVIFDKKHHFRGGKKAENYWSNCVLEKLNKEASENFIRDEIEYWKFLEYADFIRNKVYIPNLLISL